MVKARPANRGEHRVQPPGAEQAACQREACPKVREEGDRAADDMVSAVVPGYLGRIPCWSSGRVAAL